MHGTLSDTGYALPAPSLPPSMERALLIRVERLKSERDAKAAEAEWCIQRVHELSAELMYDARQIRQFRQLLHTRGRRDEG